MLFRRTALACLLTLTVLGCESPTEPTLRSLGLSPPDFVWLPQGNPEIAIEGGGSVIVRIVTFGGCPVTKEDTEVVRSGAYVAVFPYEYRRAHCPELHQTRAYVFFLHTHEVTLSPEDGSIDQVDVVMLDYTGRVVTLSTTIEAGGSS